MRTLHISVNNGPDIALHEFSSNPNPTARQILYIHGATFPAKLSVGFKFDGHSWADSLTNAGYGVWGLDFAGFGDSARYDKGEYGDSRDVQRQIKAALDQIIARTSAEIVSVIAHSWGTIAAGQFAATYPNYIDKLVLFGAIAQRSGPLKQHVSEPTRQVTIQDQYDRFVADVPVGTPAVLSDNHFADWAEAYLASDPMGLVNDAVTVPSGPARDIAALWNGQFPYDLSRITCPVLIVRGEWDSLITDQDATWFMQGLSRAPEKADIVIPKATHLAHLESSRFALYNVTQNFLR